MGAPSTIIISTDMAFARSSPDRTSRNMLRATAKEEPLPRAWTGRSAIIISIDPTPAISRLTSVKTTSAAMIGRRRPIASDTGPASSGPNIRPKMNAVTVICVEPADAFRDAAISGKAGRYMSTEIGPSDTTRLITR